MNRARPDPISAPDSQQFDAKLSKTPRIQTAAPKCTGISERREFTSLSEHSAADRTKASRIRTGVDRNRAEAKPQHSSAPQRGTKTRNPAPKPHNSAESPGISTPCLPRRRRRSPASDRPRITASPVLLRGRTRRDPSTPAELFPPPLPLGCSLFLLLALLGLSSFTFISLPPFSLLALLSALRLGFFFWWWRCVVRWCGLAKTPQNQPPS